ncbi:DUF4055 domain-containing protein [Rodentibacter haemolyticus]|uniref:DUF4055 domain-containing protein n=1 Tax=Rodentibacter haemolyticus TaxID=2778911 RepID=A0ABX6UWR3_9PAST|nr:DUF4055 domain-containing protein [Rodentibacter haemolyticus]QPB42214.1 DUF4055 domain-containing protein [Rodentibacter haemolyticus]
MSDVSTVSSEMAALHKQIQLIDDLLGGTAQMRHRREKYLPQMELESDKSYRNRLNRSTLYPALSETLSQMCGRVFFKAISTENIHATLQQNFLPDVDAQGNNLDVFSARWFYSALAYGVSYVLVDYTRTENVKTLADEKAAGARPYLVEIKPQSVLGFKTAIINGKQQLTQFRYKENVIEDDGEFAVKTVEQICVYEIGRVRKYRKQQNGWQLVEDLQLFAQNRPLAYIPIVAFSTNKKGFMLGETPLLELAYLNIKHFQSQSDQDNILNTARVPLLVRVGINNEHPVKIGGSLIDVPQNGDLRYVEHSGNAITAGQESLKELESQMRVAGAKLLDKTVLAMTDSQARDEQGKEISQLRLYANQFEDALDLALEYVGNWLGIQQVGSVEISGNIDSDFDPNQSMDTVIKLQNAGTLSKQTTFEEAKRRGLISDNLQWEDEQARLDAEGLGLSDENQFSTETDT